MRRNRKWLAATTAVVMVAAFAAPVFHNVIQSALARAASMRVLPQAAPGDPAEPIEVRGSQPKRPPVSLTIAGEISGLAPGAAPDSILVRVGNRSFSGQIQGGGYVATIDALDPAEMVDVQVLSQRVRYRSVVGSFGKLIAHTGGDRRVDAVELPTLRVSPWSSALAFLVSKVLDGRDAASDREFEQASRSLLGDDLFGARSLLEGVSSGTVALPNGYADGQQLLENEAAYSAWLNSDKLKPEAVFAQADYAPLAFLSQLPPQTLMMAPIQRDNFPVFSNAPQLLLSNTDGSYSLYEGDSEEARPTYTAQLAASGDVLLLPRTPRVYERYEGVTRMRLSLDRIVLRRLFDGEHYDLWATRQEWTKTAVDQPALPPQPYWSMRLWSVSDLQEVARAGSWISAPTRRALPWPCTQRTSQMSSGLRLENCDFVQHRFDAGGGGLTEDHGFKVGADMQPQAAEAGVAFAWYVEGRALVVDTPLATLRYWSVDGDDAVDTVVYIANGKGANAAQTWSGVSGSLAVDSLQFEVAQAQGVWTLASAATLATAYPNPHYTLEIQRDAGGVGEQRQDGYGLGPRAVPNKWDMVQGRVYDVLTTAEFGPGQGRRNVHDCVSAFAAGALTCAPARIRTFRPLHRVGDGLYGIEELHMQFEQKPPGYAGVYDVVSSARPNFQRCLAGACLTPPALRLPAAPALRLPASPGVVESRPVTPILAVVRPGKTRTAMPIYAFQCSACGHSFDRLQKLSDADPSVCPSCGAEAVGRQLTAPQFRLAGGGWYETDFKKDGDKKRNLVDGGSGAPKPAETKAEPAKSEPKPAAKPAASSE
ncbi:putative regulatory protein, FmdB family [Lysobacter sp. cf310]|nr:putative regulatory protein, FmdB family [Lysobacter sp. cf310]